VNTPLFQYENCSDRASHRERPSAVLRRHRKDRLLSYRGARQTGTRRHLVRPLREATSREASKSPSNVLPIWSHCPSAGFPEGGSLTSQGTIPEIGAHVPAFVRERLEPSNGSSVAAGELRAAYEAWCVTQNQKPLSMPKFAAELKRLGYSKWKSCGLIRYRDMQLAS
jgi:hypothetical protein